MPMQKATFGWITLTVSAGQARDSVSAGSARAQASSYSHLPTRIYLLASTYSHLPRAFPACAFPVFVGNRPHAFTVNHQKLLSRLPILQYLCHISTAHSRPGCRALLPKLSGKSTDVRSRIVRKAQRCGISGGNSFALLLNSCKCTGLRLLQ